MAPGLPSSHPQPNEPNEPSVRAATTADVPEISRIQLLSPEASQWEPATYLNYSCLVAVEEQSKKDGQPKKVAGFLVFRETAPGEWEILNLAVEPAARRRGVARRLLDFALGISPGTWFLEVRETNLGAIHLYETMGFRQTSKRKAYYHNPAESGIVMQFNS